MGRFDRTPKEQTGTLFSFIIDFETHVLYNCVKEHTCCDCYVEAHRCNLTGGRTANLTVGGIANG